MKKFIIIGSIAALAFVSNVKAQGTRIGGGMAGVQSASTNVVCVIPSEEGQIAVTAASYHQPTDSATLTKFVASQKTSIFEAIATSATAKIVCTGTNGGAPSVNGRLLTTSDYVIIPDTTASTTVLPQLRKIAAVGTVTVGTKTYTTATLSGTVVTLADAPCYVIPASKVFAMTTAASSSYSPYFAIGEPRMPVAFTYLTTNPATNLEFNCVYEVWK